MKFYKCSHCGNIVAFVKNKGVPVMCCGQKMEEIVPNTSDGAAEKHLPVINVNNPVINFNNTAINFNDSVINVSVGSVAHPMEENHYIEWIALQTKQGNQRKELKPGEKAEIAFALTEGDEPVAVYAYCNLHGLWKKEV